MANRIEPNHVAVTATARRKLALFATVCIVGGVFFIWLNREPPSPPLPADQPHQYLPADTDGFGVQGSPATNYSVLKVDHVDRYDVVESIEIPAGLSKGDVEQTMRSATENAYFRDGSDNGIMIYANGTGVPAGIYRYSAAYSEWLPPGGIADVDTAAPESAHTFTIEYNINYGAN